ncbi:type III polyketide synthase [Egibacter rhizosphaerae]|uniref:Type III polyketide synthase n=1 Tax=Egibacter rhizosphaerae TaxID=1670831 RepID=A0A411YFM5_9ACTN|nr:3-oxoacyl-[acyl-carrier-protein] synthase III C-terminal domain-containing protein [Egibacter rhizosphaerae]QBI20030.1 type III polyketide synthase [Egibacter rhizosphaerae]
MTAAITGLANALPPQHDQGALWRDFFADHFGQRRAAERAWAQSGIARRHGVVDPRIEDVSTWGTRARMQRFLAEAMPLGKDALSAALDDAGLAAEELDQLVVVSCTGYATPGLDILLARDLGLAPHAQRLHIGHMGCYAAIPALAAASDAARARAQRVAVLSVELTSLHVQPPDPDIEQVVAHALFADAAAAAVLTPGPGLEIRDFEARTATAHADLMAWDVTDRGFRMRLSPRVPTVLREHVADAVDTLLARHDLDRADVAAWAVHPGGPRIIDVAADRLGLDEGQVAASRHVLAERGNCSSATVLLILEELRDRGELTHDGPVVALAFGPGLTLYAALLHAGGA